MLDNALKLIRELTEHNYKAYIVGGFVRDYLLGRESQDIDVCTNATPKEIKEVFPDGFLPTEDYGSVIVNKEGILLLILFVLMKMVILLISWVVEMI